MCYKTSASCQHHWTFQCHVQHLARSNFTAPPKKPPHSSRGDASPIPELRIPPHPPSPPASPAHEWTPALLRFLIWNVFLFQCHVLGSLVDGSFTRKCTCNNNQHANANCRKNLCNEMTLTFYLHLFWKITSSFTDPIPLHWIYSRILFPICILNQDSFVQKLKLFPVTSAEWVNARSTNPVSALLS